MKETITIKNFGGLKDAVIPLNSINIFIGKQASGKSVTAKLIYFFKKMAEDIFDDLGEDKTKKEIENNLNKSFKKYFPVESWADGEFFIKYESPEKLFSNKSGQSFKMSFPSASIKRVSKKNIKIHFPTLYSYIYELRKIFTKALEQETGKKYLKITKSSPEDAVRFFARISSVFSFQLFIPASRSFFSNIQNSIFYLLDSENIIDPFLIEFGANYQRFKHFDDVCKPETPEKHIHDSLAEILNANFVRDKTGEYLIHKDGRKINLLFCSSGQQELLPLALILRNQIMVINTNKLGDNTTYIEEPEAHLFPSAQKKIVEVISTVHNLSKDKSQLIITTHSPYILTAFNNLLQAGYLLEQGADKEKLFKIVPEFEVLKCGELNAYAFQDGGVVSLIDEETGLISADMLDQVSEEIAIQFDELLELENA